MKKALVALLLLLLGCSDDEPIGSPPTLDPRLAGLALVHRHCSVALAVATREAEDIEWPELVHIDDQVARMRFQMENDHMGVSRRLATVRMRAIGDSGDPEARDATIALALHDLRMAPKKLVVTQIESRLRTIGRALLYRLEDMDMLPDSLVLGEAGGCSFDLIRELTLRDEET